MADRRKLQGEIERCLKKVSDGVEMFEDIWQKVHSATNTNQKEKYEADLKKEIKKLQRLRDQIKTWLSSSEIKDKRQLQDTRKLIETQMERFKVVERETKTKAYSKEGLSGGVQKIDPAQKERDDMNNWLGCCISSLNIQIDQFECELESMSVTTKKGKNVMSKDASRVEELKAHLEKHRFHINKLETLMRMLDNCSIEVDKIRSVKDDINYYIDSCLEPDFEENEYLYDDLNLDESCAPLGVVEVKSTQSNATSEHGSDSPHNELSTPQTPLSATHTPLGLTPSSVPLALTPAMISNQVSQQPQLNNLHSNKSSSDSSSQSSIGTPNNINSNSPIPTPTSLIENNSGKSSMNVLTSGMQISSATVVKPVALRPPSLSTKSPQSSCSPSPAPGAHEPSKIAYSSVVATPAPHPQTDQQPAVLTPQALSAALEAPLRMSDVVCSNAGRSVRMNGSGMLSPTPSSRDQVINGPQPQLAGPVSSPTKNVEMHLLGNNSAMEGSPLVTMNALNQQGNAEPSMTSQSQQLSTTPITNGVCELEINNQQKLHHHLHQQQQQQQPPQMQSQPIPSQGNVLQEEQQQQQQQQQLQQHPQQQSLQQDAHIPPILGVAPLGKSTMPKECYYQLHHLNWASQHLPHPSDSERGRSYLLRQPCATPSYYPPGLPHSDPLEIFQRLTPDTLFFIFYYMEGTRAQYLAAKALKKQSWRFHTKFMMWFQRHEEPRTITDEFERGTYIYFDYERWSQRRKEGFTFEYRFLEDRELN